MNTTPARRKPITLGIDEMPITRIVNGIQNHTVRDGAAGDQRRARDETDRAGMWLRDVGRLRQAVMRVGDCIESVTAAMHSNLWTGTRRRHNVFPRLCRGLTPNGGALVAILTT